MIVWIILGAIGGLIALVLIIAAFSYNGLVSITTTSDAKTMPDADKFSRYIREAANELEAVILERGKRHPKPQNETLKSYSFFIKFKKYLTETIDFKSDFEGIIDFQITAEKTVFPTQIVVSEKGVTVKKEASENASITIEIDDLVLYHLSRKKLLLKEVIIQERIKIAGNSKNKALFLKTLTAFFNQ